jgi:hypothetical protein
VAGEKGALSTVFFHPEFESSYGAFLEEQRHTDGAPKAMKDTPPAVEIKSDSREGRR